MQIFLAQVLFTVYIQTLINRYHNKVYYFQPIMLRKWGFFVILFHELLDPTRQRMR